MYFITTKRMLEVCFFQHTPTFIIEPYIAHIGANQKSRSSPINKGFGATFLIYKCQTRDINWFEKNCQDRKLYIFR